MHPVTPCMQSANVRSSETSKDDDLAISASSSSSSSEGDGERDLVRVAGCSVVVGTQSSRWNVQARSSVLWRDSLSSWSQISCHVQPNDVTPRLDLPEITHTKTAAFIIRPHRTASARRGLLLQTAYRGCLSFSRRSQPPFSL